MSSHGDMPKMWKQWLGIIYMYISKCVYKCIKSWGKNWLYEEKDLLKVREQGNSIWGRGGGNKGGITYQSLLFNGDIHLPPPKKSEKDERTRILLIQKYDKKEQKKTTLYICCTQTLP